MFEKLAPVISGLFGLGSNIATNIGAKRRERDARKFNERMERDRRAYDTKQWERQMAYNHPLQQMSRLAEAGLNPNLIYGSSPGSAVGNISQSPTGKAVTGQAPNYRIDNPMVPFMNTKVQQAQANNMNTAAMKNIADANLTKSQEYRLNKLLGGEIRIQDENIGKATQEHAQAVLKTKAMGDTENGIAARYAAETKNLILDNEIKDASLEVEKLNAFLAKNNIRPGDPLWYRFMGYAFNKGKEITGKVRKEIEKTFNTIIELFK